MNSLRHQYRLPLAARQQIVSVPARASHDQVQGHWTAFTMQDTWEGLVSDLAGLVFGPVAVQILGPDVSSALVRFE